MINRYHFQHVTVPPIVQDTAPERIDYDTLRDLIGTEVITRHDFDSHIESMNVDVERRGRYEAQIEKNQQHGHEH